jgi:hypothetical protein
MVAMQSRRVFMPGIMGRPCEVSGNGLK